MLCVLISLILLYASISTTIIVIIAVNYTIEDKGIISAIVILSILMSIAVSSMIYFLIVSYRRENQVNEETPPPPNIPVVTTSGSLIQQPNGDIQLGIKMLPVGIEPTTSGS